MTIEQKTYEARKAINFGKADLFAKVFQYFHENGAMHGMWESYKSYKVSVQKVSDDDLRVLDRLAPREARLFRLQNEFIDQGLTEDEQWSAYHIRLDEMTYEGLKMTLVSKPENEDYPAKSDLVVTITAEGENINKKLAELVGKFDFKEV